MKRTSYKSLKSTKKALKKQRAALLVIGLAVGLLIVLELTNTTHIFHKQKAASTTIESTGSRSISPSKDKMTNFGYNNSPSQTTTNNETKDKPPTVSKSDGPITPYGNFVSNHSPGMSGSSTAEQSVCTTTPGASCTITFTNSDGVVKTLGSTVADSTGTAYWNWDVNAAGFTAGPWQITAKATLNGQSKTAQDQIALKVQ